MKCSYCKSDKVKKSVISYKKINFNICDNCGCHYQFPVKETDYVSENYWKCDTDPDGNIRNLSNERDNKIKNWYGEAISFVNQFNNIKVLDYGCGLGFFLSAINNNITKFGIEESQYGNDYIKKNFPDINILKGGEKTLAQLDEKFDIIFFYHVIEHVKNPSSLFEELTKKLKKNGVIILGTPVVNTALSNFFGGNFRHYIPEHITLFDLKALKNLFLKNSFKIIKVEKPYFKTNYFNFKNVVRILNPKKISPPYRGSIVTIYGKKTT